MGFQSPTAIYGFRPPRRLEERLLRLRAGRVVDFRDSRLPFGEVVPTPPTTTVQNNEFLRRFTEVMYEGPLLSRRPYDSTRIEYFDQSALPSSWLIRISGSISQQFDFVRV